ncbi:MAG: T9SS type A sorting domain-containing protein, partial [Crocinitomicaceae bacterium]|nr:T9SS type A sorting domain-containing protein [Crocinitomicaceae bacterium]
SSSSTDIISACDAVTWIDGNTYTASTNSPTHIIPNSAGCDSIITLNLTITNSPIANASLTGFILTSISTASTYQWIDCDNGNAIIAGETAQIFSPNTDGNYAVILSNGSCSDTSSCVTVSGLGFNEENIFNALIYPNPTSGKLMIVFPNEIDNVQVNIIDGIGQIISSEKNFSGVLYEFDLIGESGIYVVEIISDSAHLRIPVSKI